MAASPPSTTYGIFVSASTCLLSSSCARRRLCPLPSKATPPASGFCAASITIDRSRRRRHGQYGRSTFLLGCGGEGQAACSLQRRAVLNRPWPSPVLIPPYSPSGKHRTLVATTKDIGDPISPEEIAALEDKEGDDDANARFYKAMARTDVFMRNYVHEHGSLYMDENDGCKRVTTEEMEAKIMKREVTRQETSLSELALASFNKRRKVKFELCETLFSNSFWQNRDSFVHLNFVAKRKDKKTLFFAEIEECGRVGEQILQVRCCVPLDSLCEGGYHYFCVDPPRHGYRKSLDLTRCYACTEFLKHPVDGSTYTGGHDHRKRMYL